MSSYGSDDFNLSALDDYSPWGTPNRTSTPIPPAAGVGLSLNPFTAIVTGDTAPAKCLVRRSRHSWLGCTHRPTSRRVSVALAQVTLALQRHSGCRCTRMLRNNVLPLHTFGTSRTRGGKRPRRVPRQNTPTSSSDAGSRRRSSASGSGGGRGRGRGRGRGGRGGGGGGGGVEAVEEVEVVAVDDSTPPSSMRSGRGGRRRRGDRILNQAQMQQQLEEILRQQQQTAAGRRIAGITTTNTITTTYKNGQRPTVTRNSTSVRN